MPGDLFLSSAAAALALFFKTLVDNHAGTLYPARSMLGLACSARLLHPVVLVFLLENAPHALRLSGLSCKLTPALPRAAKLHEHTAWSTVLHWCGGRGAMKTPEAGLASGLCSTLAVLS